MRCVSVYVCVFEREYGFLVACALSTPHQMSICILYLLALQEDSLHSFSLIVSHSPIFISNAWLQCICHTYIYLYKMYQRKYSRHAKNGQHQHQHSAGWHRCTHHPRYWLRSKVSKYYFHHLPPVYMHSMQNRCKIVYIGTGSHSLPLPPSVSPSVCFFR